MQIKFEIDLAGYHNSKYKPYLVLAEYQDGHFYDAYARSIPKQDLLDKLEKALDKIIYSFESDNNETN